MSLEKFLRNVSGNKDVETSMGNTFTPSGDWTRLLAIDVVITRIINQLMIVRGTYVFDPKYGENILRFLFEPADSVTHRQISETVQTVINQNKGKYNITNEVLFYKNKRGFQIFIIIDSNGITKKIPITIDETMLKESV
jgi:phage baseplate assembly protein W